MRLSESKKISLIKYYFSCQMKNKNLSPKEYLGTVSTGKLLLNFAIPGILGGLVGAMASVVDQIFIGQKIGILGNAAANIVFPVFSFSIGLSLLLGIGASVNFNILQGKKKENDAANIMGNGLSSLFIIGIALGLLVILFCKPMLYFFGVTENVYHYASVYAKIIGFGLPFSLFTIGGTILIKADSSPKTAMLLSIGSAIINIILDYLFIFVFDFGIAGAAWATVISYVCSSIYGIYYFIYKFQSMPLVLHNLILKMKYIKKILLFGSSPFISHAALFAVTIILNNSLAYHGARSVYGPDVPLAVSGVVSKCNYFFMSFAIGIAQGCQPIAGFNFGAQNYNRVIRLFKQALISILSLGVVAFLIFQIFPHHMVSIFGGGDENYYDFAIKFVRKYSFFVVFVGLGPLVTNFYLAIGKPVYSIILNLIKRVIIFIPVLLIFTKLWGIEGLLWSGFASDGLSFIIMSFFLYYIYYVLRKKEISKTGIKEYPDYE